MTRGIIFGAFDLLHPGHLYTLAKCKENCEWLIVGLQVDPSWERKDKNRPVETIMERWLRLKACKWVDEIIPYETENDVLNILKMGGIDIRFNGEDHAGKDEPSIRDKVCFQENIKIAYVPRHHDWSTTELRKRIKK